MVVEAVDSSQQVPLSPSTYLQTGVRVQPPCRQPRRQMLLRDHRMLTSRPSPPADLVDPDLGESVQSVAAARNLLDHAADDPAHGLPVHPHELAAGALRALQLRPAAEAVPAELERAGKEGWSPTIFLGAAAGDRGECQRAAAAGWAPALCQAPRSWRLKDFNFDAQPALDRTLVEELATLRFLDPSLEGVTLQRKLALRETIRGKDGRLHRYRLVINETFH